MQAPYYIIGVDLGTTHCVVSYARFQEDRQPDLRIFETIQIIAPQEIRALPLLPSFIFLPGPHDVSPESVKLPWQGEVSEIVGEFARRRGAEIPHRLVSSAKSWLCHSGVDRTQPILPWGSPREGKKLSPVEAMAVLLRHIREAWNYTMARQNPEHAMEYQDIYLTVPASFDVVARELTLQAARMAGIERFTLLEEPQAAFYGWIHANEQRWRDFVKVGEVILVCDVGGGTTDFSMIEVSEEDGSLSLRRIAVGDHILLGGDNMDLALAHLLRRKITSRLDEWQFRMLWYQARSAKEKLLEPHAPDREPVVVLGRGSSLIGGTIKTELTIEELHAVLLDGFFPLCALDDHPQRRAKLGMREMGLPYEEDPAVTKHMAYFVSRQAKDGSLFPSAVLFNGGVMKAEPFRQRILMAVQSWRGDTPVRELASPDLDLSVARGAAYYGFARRGRGIRIRAGASRSYYIGIESAMPSVPGVPTLVKALCVVPFGMEEGTSVEIREREFGLLVGEPVVFNLMASSTRQEDGAGAIVEDWEGAIETVAVMETNLTSPTDEGEGASPQEGAPPVAQIERSTVIPVWLQSTITEIGTLELHCVDLLRPSRKWKLQFNLKERNAHRS